MMPQGFEIIRARIKDNAAILIDRLMRSKQQEVVLVLPKNSIIAADLNSLKILKEETESIGKTLSLSTENNEIKSFAKKIKISVYDHKNFPPPAGRTEPVKQIKRIKVMTDILPPSFNYAFKINNEVDEMSKEDIALGIQESPEESEPNDVEAADAPAQNQNSDLEKNIENFYREAAPDEKKGDFGGKSENRWHHLRLNHIVFFLVIGGFFLFGASVYLVLPKADINISIKKIPLKAQIPVAVSKNINSLNLASGIIPGQYFSLDKTGSKIVEGSLKIGGVIEIYNAYSAAPQKLIANTRFETKDGKTFRIQSPVIVPGAKISGAKLIPSSIKTNVVAEAMGDEYLIGPSYFTIPGFKGTPKYAGFYALSVESMATTESALISKEELEKNKNELRDKLAQELKSDLLITLKDSDLRLIDGASAIKIDYFKVGGKSLSMKITWQALLFKEKDLRTMIGYFISNHQPDLKNFTFEDNIEYPKASRSDFIKGELFFTFNIDKNDALPADIETLKKELAGRDEIGMRTVISDKIYINSAAIFLWPFWVKKAPNNLNKINITIDN